MMDWQDRTDDRLPIDAAEEAGEITAEEPARTPAPTAFQELPGIALLPRINIAAFAETEGVKQVLHRVAGDRRMSRANFELVEGGLRAAAGHFREAATPDLILAESRLSNDALFAALEHLAEHCPPGTRVVVIGHENDVALYRRLVRFGVGDYLVTPLDAVAVIEAVAQLVQEGEAERLGKVTAFIGARGGAGSSTVAANTAAAIARHCDSQVLLVDLDLSFGSLALDLNMETAQDVQDALDQGERLEESLLDRLITPRDDKIRLLAAPCEVANAREPDPAAVARLIEVARTTTPHLLLDLPHCWSRWLTKALLAADEIVMTATPDLAALRNARNIAAAAKAARPNDPAPRLVLNMVGMPKRREVAAADFARVLELEPTAAIPHDAAAFGLAATRGDLIAETGSQADASAAFERLARAITGRKAPEPAARGIARFTRLLGRGA